MKFFCLPSFVLYLIFIFLAAASPLMAAQESADALTWRQADLDLAEGRGEAAYQAFVQLLLKYPGHNALRLGQARAAVLTSRLNEAANIYSDLLKKFPGDKAIIAELVVIQQKLGLGESAPTPPPTVINGQLRLGFLYDSNANQGPASESMKLGLLPLTLPGAAAKETAAAYFGANLNLTHQFNPQSPWAVVGDFGLFIRANENQVLSKSNTREWQWTRLAAGLRYIKDKNFLETRLKAELFDYELTNSILAVGPEITYLRALNPHVYLITQFAGDWRSYKRSPSLNGFYGQSGESIRFIFGPSEQFSFNVGGNYLWGSPHAEKQQYDGYSIPARFGIRFNDRFTAGFHGSYTRENYKGPANPLEIVDRNDDRIRAGLDLGIGINDNWTLEINYAHSRNDSTSPLYTYRQNVLGLGVSWSF